MERALRLPAFAATACATYSQKGGANINDVKMWAGAGAGFAIGLGVLGGALGQGRAAAAGLEGIQSLVVSKLPRGSSTLDEGYRRGHGEHERQPPHRSNT